MTKTKKFSIKSLALLMALISLFSSFSITAEAAAKTPAAVYVAVKRAYSTSFPLTSNDRISGKKRVLGVKTSYLSSYYAASKVTGGSSDQCEYTIFIGKAKSKKKAKKVKKALDKYLKNEQLSMNNYLSYTGKSLFQNAKTGRKGKYVYLVMIDTAGNSKAIRAIKKSL